MTPVNGFVRFKSHEKNLEGLFQRGYMSDISGHWVWKDTKSVHPRLPFLVDGAQVAAARWLWNTRYPEDSCKGHGLTNKCGYSRCLKPEHMIKGVNNGCERHFK